MTGEDILNALEKITNCDKILIPATALRSGENIFLDDMTLESLQKKFSAQIIPIRTGAEFLKILCGEKIKPTKIFHTYGDV